MGHTLVTFHAHPDDAEIQCGGTMARAKAEGHRVVLVVATRGELGEIRAGVLTDGEALAERRVAETKAGAGILGVDRVEFLGYVDSGMAGESTNDDGRQLRRRRRRRSRDAPCSVTARGTRRRAHCLRRQRWLRPSRPRAGAPRRRARGRDRGNGRTCSRLRRTASTSSASWRCNRKPLDDIAGRRSSRPPRTSTTLGVAEALITTTVDVRDYVDRQTRCDGRPREPGRAGVVLPRAARRRVPRGVRPRVVHPPRRAAGTAETWLFDDLEALTPSLLRRPSRVSRERRRGSPRGELVDVGHQLAARDEAEVDVVEVRHHRHVEPAVVEDRAQRVQARRAGRPAR